MDIHRPKAVHSQRELLSEVGIIVIGVLIALAGEQIVESLHHRSEAAELSEALDQELSYNLAVLKDSVDLKPRLDNRLAEIERWTTSASSDHPVVQARALGRPPGQIFHAANWRAASGSGIELLSVEKRVSYAHFYDGFSNVDRIRETLREKWSDIADFEGAESLTPRKALRLRHDVRDIRAASDLLAANFESVSGQLSAELRITPDKGAEPPKTQAFLQKQRQEFCD